MKSMTMNNINAENSSGASHSGLVYFGNLDPQIQQSGITGISMIGPPTVDYY